MEMTANNRMEPTPITPNPEFMLDPGAAHAIRSAYKMKFIFSFLVLTTVSAFASAITIPDSPFEIDCPPDWYVASGRFAKDKEYDPNKGIESSIGHIHIYRRLAKDEATAIAETESTYRKLELQRRSPMPFLWSTSSFITDSGIKGTFAYFGHGKSPSDKIKEKKFYFLYEGSIYCACLETRDSDHWPLLERILHSLKPTKKAHFK